MTNLIPHHTACSIAVLYFSSGLLYLNERCSIFIFILYFLYTIIVIIFVFKLKRGKAVFYRRIHSLYVFFNHAYECDFLCAGAAFIRAVTVKAKSAAPSHCTLKCNVKG